MQNSILTNMTSIKIQSIFSTTQNDISTSLKRMASGVKLNQAKDGAADYVISTQMKNRLSGLNGSIENISHGENMLLEMDKSLENILEKVNKIQTLALQASNAGYGDEERIAIQNQIDQLRREVYREKEIVTYGDKKVFEPDEIKEVKPYAYEVEYIESNGTQYIDTGIVANEKTKVQTKIQCIGKQTGSNIFGARPGSSGATDAFVITSFSGSKKIGFFYNDKSIPAIQYDNNIHEYELSGNMAKIDGVDYGLTNNAPFTTQYSLTLFGNANGGAQMTTSQRIFTTKIYDDNELIRDYVPVVDHNGKVALYDKVNEELVYDENGRDFIAGPPVITPPPTISTTTLQVGGDAGIDNTIKLSLNVEFGILTGSVMNEADSKTLLNSAQSYMDNVLISRSQIGSALNRLEAARNLQNNDIVNLNSSKSTITDTDIASESAKLAHNQILQQVSASLFSQANGINGNLALRLLSI